MPKRRQRRTNREQNLSDRSVKAYYNFIEWKELDEREPNFTIEDVFKWIKLDQDVDVPHNTVMLIGVMMVHKWIKNDLAIKTGNQQYAAIDFINDDVEDVTIDGQETIDYEDDYLRSYGRRDMSFPKIDDRYDDFEESRRIRGERCLGKSEKRELYRFVK